MTMQQINTGETRTDSVDFAALLGSGVTLSSVTSVVADPDGDLEFGTATIVGTSVVFTVTGVVVGKRYEVTVTVVTSSVETLVEKAPTIAGM